MAHSDRTGLDAIVVGSGPNGLAAAVTLAQAGLKVTVFEAQSTIGGGARTAELTLPGFRHDLCSAVHPLGAGSPFLRALELGKHGLEWIHPPLPLAHPLDGGGAASIARDFSTPDDCLGSDREAWRSLFEPFSSRWDELALDALKPVGLPRSPALLAAFGLRAIRSTTGLARARFAHPYARALLAGIGAHSILPLEQSPSAAVAMMLGTALHAVGWPVAKGGSQSIADALARTLRAHGAEIVASTPIRGLSDLPPARLVLFDLTPRQILSVADDSLTPSIRSAFEEFRYGPGVFKIDWALAGAIPWTNAACRQAGTVHVGGTLEEISSAELAPWQDRHAEKPFVLLAQPSVFDPTRAPPGKHVAWAYCHVPAGSVVDMTAAIESQVERFAPGFRDLVIARATADCAQLEGRNANLVGGDITGGVADLRQLFFRPRLASNPYALGRPGHYICSASTPPGAGVHGMCGHFAARAALAWLRDEDRG